MECEKRELMMYQQGTDIFDQFYLDEDFNVPDAKRDVKSIILTEGKVQIEEIKQLENYVRVSGNIPFKVLYVTDEGERKITSLDGKIPFEEMVYTEEEPKRNLFLKNVSAEMNIQVIHSRKLNVKASVELLLSSDENAEEVFMVNIEDDRTTLYKRYKEHKILCLKDIKKDTYRIKEEFAIGGTKETIGTLLWSDVICRKLDTRLAKDEILLQGELLVFVFYESADGKTDWIEQCVPYQGKINCYGIHDSMYHEIYPDISNTAIEVRMDEDGELRIIHVEATLSVRVILYEEENLKLLDDVYSLEEDCLVSRTEKNIEQVLMQNHIKCKVSEKLSLPEIKDDILQICHSSARIQIDQTKVQDNGVFAEGILHINFMYVKPDDQIPFDVWQGMIPFSCLLESNETCEGMICNLHGTVEQLSIGLLGNDEIEVKAVIAIQSFMKREVQIQNIESITLKPLDSKEQKNMPGVIGYIVKTGDNLWDLAKKYHTTMERIMEVNGLEEMELKYGQKLLIFRENVSIL